MNREKYGFPSFNPYRQPVSKFNIFIPLSIAIAFIILIVGIARAEPKSIWKALVAEECYLRPKSWQYKDQVNLYTHLAWVVKNRLNKGMSIGLVAAKRKNLDKFIDDEDKYILAMRGWEFSDAAIAAQKYVFFAGVVDTTKGATNYEHTKKYKTPKWAKKMKVVKVLFPNTKNEITFWKG